MTRGLRPSGKCLTPIGFALKVCSSPKAGSSSRESSRTHVIAYVRCYYRGTASPVVPIRGGVALAFLVEADEEFFDEEPVIEDDRGDRGHLLIGQIWVLDVGEAGLVAASEHAAEFAARGLYAARNDQGGIAEIDDPYVAAVFDAPPVSKLGRQIGLATVRHLGR